MGARDLTGRSLAGPKTQAEVWVEVAHSCDVWVEPVVVVVVK